MLTDEQGRFTRLLPADAENVQFRLSHPEHISYHFAERSETAPVAALKDGSAVIVMKRGLPTSGVVKDAAGKPVSDAFVMAGRLYSRTPSPESETIEDTTTFRTAADGRFRIGGLPPGWRDVTVVGHTFAPTLTRIEAKADAPPAEVVVQPGVSYAGRIVDPEGKPVEGARIGADEWVVGGQQLRAGTRVATTDADGRFALHHLPKEGRLEMYVGKAPYLGMSFNWSAQGEAPKQLTMCPEPVLRGKVVDAETGAPIKDAMAHPWWGKPAHSLTFDRPAKTGADGAFELKIQRVSISAEGPPPFFAKVIARGYVPQMSPAVFPDKPSSEPMTIKLEKGEPIGGTVVDADGNPLAGAEVMLVEAHNNAHVQRHRLNDDFGPAPDPVARTDALGFFELPPSKAGGRLLVLHEKGYMVLPYPGHRPGDKIAVLPWAKVEGVARKDGKPLHGAVATLNPTNDRGLFGTNIHFQLRAATHTDGKFVVENVPSIPLNVTINQGEQQTQGPEITPAPGETTNVEAGGAAAPGAG